MNLYHYYDSKVGPFVNLSDVPIDEANAVLDKIKELKPNSQSAKRDPEYMNRRLMYEEILRREFSKKGGIIQRKSPHYLVVEHSPWLLNEWFENSAYIKIPISEFDLRTVSFTYGDSHPVFSKGPHKMDDKEYRRKLYNYDEILQVIEKYGLPQNWNKDGNLGPERYVEAHVWCDDVIKQYLAKR